MEKEIFVELFHRDVEKIREKVWHNIHTKIKHFEFRDLVLMYDSKFFKHPGKMKTHWLGPYLVKEITDGGVVKLEKLDGIEVRGIVKWS